VEAPLVDRVQLLALEAPVGDRGLPSAYSVETAHVAGALRRGVVKQLLGCVAVRVEEADAITPGNHLDQDIAEQVGLS
jgi:hypothetical protein